MKNVQTPLAKTVLLSLELTAEASDVSINITSLGSGTTVIISNKEMKDIIKIFKSLE